MVISMKRYTHIIVLVMLIFLVSFVGINLYLSKVDFFDKNKDYKVSLNRLNHIIVEYENKNHTAPQNLEELLSFQRDIKYINIVGFTSISKEASSQEEIISFLTNGEQPYMILTTENYCYLVIYTDHNEKANTVRWIVNGVLLLSFVIVLGTLLYIRQKILRPFAELSDIPYKLSKGYLNVPFKEYSSRFFGKFLWGLDMLRERLEENRQQELYLQREKKMQLLSLSHDIKTPLSAIKLYASALDKNLYSTEEKQKEISKRIGEKVNAIEAYVTEIVRASQEDFLHFEVKNREFYIEESIEYIREYYQDKMQLNHINFHISSYHNCLVYGDPVRLVEVLQNIIENAIKYGDGKRIWLTLNREIEEYGITILNTGCQLRNKELPHIFDSFFRGSNVSREQGSGLGLYIGRELMHQMEGEITGSIHQEEDNCNMVIYIALRLL